MGGGGGGVSRLNILINLTCQVHASWFKNEYMCILEIKSSTRSKRSMFCCCVVLCGCWRVWARVPCVLEETRATVASAWQHSVPERRVASPEPKRVEARSAHAGVGVFTDNSSTSRRHASLIDIHFIRSACTSLASFRRTQTNQIITFWYQYFNKHISWLFTLQIHILLLSILSGFLV